MITIPHRYSVVVNVSSNSKSGLKLAIISLPYFIGKPVPVLFLFLNILSLNYAGSRWVVREVTLSWRDSRIHGYHILGTAYDVCSKLNASSGMHNISGIIN